MWCWFWHVLSKKLVNEAVKIRRKKVLFILDDIKYLFYFIINDHQVTSLCFTVFFGVHPALSLSGQLVTAGLVWRPSQRTTLGFSFCSDEAEGNNKTRSGRTNFFKETVKNICTFLHFWGKKSTKGVVKKTESVFRQKLTKFSKPHLQPDFCILNFQYVILSLAQLVL